jgi:hypothetical protein
MWTRQQLGDDRFLFSIHLIYIWRIFYPNSSVADPGWLKERIRIRDEQPESYFRELKNHFLGLKYLNSLMRIRDGKNSDPGFRMEKIRIRDPGWKKLGFGIQDKHPGSATLPNN